MLLRMLKKDVLRKKSITAGLFIFIMLSAVLASSAAHIIGELTGSLNHLLEVSRAPHFVQMHSGTVDDYKIREFAARNRLVKAQQTVEMLNIDGSDVTLGDSTTSEAASVMDIGFVIQNREFDLLLDLHNQIITVSRGEIAVPIYYKLQNNLSLGDTVTVSDGKFMRKFRITDFVRDPQMNPNIVSSKRFVVSGADYTAMRQNLGETETLIEFQLKDLSRLSEFRNAYQNSGLPQKGPSIDYSLIKTLNALTDGVIAAVIILVSLLLMVIAMLCLRFTMLAAIEEDYREIGVMKAIGIAQKEIRRLYLAKYVVLAATASAAGYALSLIMARFFTANITLYLGTAPASLLQQAVPVLAAAVNCGIIVSFCRIILRRFKVISAVEALRTGTAQGSKSLHKRFPLSKRNWIHTNVFLGLKDVYARFRMFLLLIIVVAVCLFIVAVPVNILNTLESPRFISYLGVGQSDIRIDLQQNGDTLQRFEQMVADIGNDPDIASFSPLVTSRFKVLGSGGVWENLNVETGDFTTFPLSYTSGAAPAGRSEIALSALNARELGRKVGDTLLLKVNGTEEELKVSGIYQDITNGGRTAKAQIAYDPMSVMWFVVAADVKPGVPLEEKIEQYAKRFHPAKITRLEGYLEQTLGNTVKQLKIVILLALAVSVSILVLITSLFLNMLLAKDVAQIALMRSIGFTLKDITFQYMMRMLPVTGLGIITGAAAAGTLGQSLVRVPAALMGAPRIQLVIHPAAAYLILPIVFSLIAGITTLGVTRLIKRSSIVKGIAD